MISINPVNCPGAQYGRGQHGSILTINQGIPLQGMADVSISIETKNMNISADELMKKLDKLPGVSKVDIIGQA